MYVVTGGAGFIGSIVLKHMEDQRLGPLVCCDRLRDGDKWRNIAKRELFDIIAPEDLFAYLDAHADVIDGVVHMGAISATTETDADLIAATNIRLPIRLWDWCTQHHTRFIYASSAATYGDGAQGFDDDGSVDGLAALQPMNAYGWSKHMFDRRVARLVADGHPTPPQWASLKFFNVYGPNEYHKGGQQSVVAHLVPQIRRDGRVKLFKSHRADIADGQQLRDFVHVDDCAAMVMWLLRSPDVCGVFNCGSGQARSFADLAAATFDALGVDAAIDYIPMPEAIREKYQYFTQAEMARARAAGFEHTFRPIEDGVRSYVAEYLVAEDAYA